MESQQKNKAVLLVESQPPHIGEILQAIQALTKYDFVYICLTVDVTVMSFDHVLSIWVSLLAPYMGRFKVVRCIGNFKEVMEGDLPIKFNMCTFLTPDREIFVHLSSLNVMAELIPRALGYHGIFLRTAFRQSKALDYLEARFINQAILERNNKR